VGPKSPVTSCAWPWAYGLACIPFGFSLRDQLVYNSDRFCIAAGVSVDPRCCSSNGRCGSASSCTCATSTCDECGHHDLAKSETCGCHVPDCRQPCPSLNIRVPLLAAHFRHPSDKSSNSCDRTNSGSWSIVRAWSRHLLSHAVALVLELTLFSVRRSTGGDSPDPHPRTVTRASRRTPEASSSSRWSKRSAPTMARCLFSEWRIQLRVSRIPALSNYWRGRGYLSPSENPGKA